MNAREFDSKLGELISQVSSQEKDRPSLPTVIGILEMHQHFLVAAYMAGTAQGPSKPSIIPVKVLPKPPGEAGS